MLQKGYYIEYSDRKLISENFPSVLFSDKLDNVKKRIYNELVHGDFSHDGTYRTDYYFSEKEGYFIAISKIPVELIKKCENRIKFVSATKRKLKNLVDSFKLPYDKEKVFASFDLLNE